MRILDFKVLNEEEISMKGVKIIVEVKLEDEIERSLGKYLFKHSHDTQIEFVDGDKLSKIKIYFKL